MDKLLRANYWRKENEERIKKRFMKKDKMYSADCDTCHGILTEKECQEYFYKHYLKPSLIGCIVALPILFILFVMVKRVIKDLFL